MKMKESQNLLYASATTQRLTHASIVMEMNLNVTTNYASECSDEFINLSGVRTTDRIGDSDTIHANLVDGLVDGEEVDEIGAEGILGGEADFDTLGLDEVDDLDGRLGDICHILSMREFAQE